MNSVFEILLVLGAAFEHNKELDNVLSKHNSAKKNVQIVENIKNVAETMYSNDVVFTSPGLSFFEALQVKTPVLCFHQNKFQFEAWKGYITTIDKSEVFKLQNLIKNRSFIFPDDQFIVSMEVGKGMDDIIYEVLS